MVSRPRETGHTMIEVLCAIAILTILSTAWLSGGRAHLGTVARSYDDVRAVTLADERLEVLTSDESVLTPGDREFEVETAGLTGHERIREVEPGLFEITVNVSARENVVAELVTLAAREVAR